MPLCFLALHQSSTCATTIDHRIKKAQGYTDSVVQGTTWSRVLTRAFEPELKPAEALSSFHRVVRIKRLIEMAIYCCPCWQDSHARLNVGCSINNSSSINNCSSINNGSSINSQQQKRNISHNLSPQLPEKKMLPTSSSEIFRKRGRSRFCDWGQNSSRKIADHLKSCFNPTKTKQARES